MQWAKKQTGFTIVELLIVIVVIGILAAITIVAFNGVQNKAYDAAVQSDLTNTAKLIRRYNIENGAWPEGGTQLSGLGIKISKSAYGDGLLSGGNYFNLVYCWPNTANPNTFSLVAQSKSGNVFQYVDGQVSQSSHGYTNGSIGICSASGVVMDSGSNRDWFYDTSAWQGYTAG